MKSRKYTNALVTDGAQVYESPRVPGTHRLRSAGSMESPPWAMRWCLNSEIKD